MIAQKRVSTVYYSEELEGYDSSLTFKLAEEFGIDIIKLNYEKV
jgi:hypothetical protein